MKITNKSGFQDHYESLPSHERWRMRKRFIRKWALKDDYHFRKKMTGKSDITDKQIEQLKKYIDASK